MFFDFDEIFNDADLLLQFRHLLVSNKKSNNENKESKINSDDDGETIGVVKFDEMIKVKDFEILFDIVIALIVHPYSVEGAVNKIDLKLEHPLTTFTNKFA